MKRALQSASLVILAAVFATAIAAPASAQTDTRFGVQLTRQISRTNCVLNRNWGSDQNGVWVSNGCRAEFSLNTRGGTR